MREKLNNYIERLQKIGKFFITAIEIFSSRRKKRFVFRWGFILLSFFIVIIVIISSPGNFFKKAFTALNSETTIINLYASNCYPETESEDYKQGWWNSSKAQGVPNIEAQESFQAFSDETAAFYAKGKQAIICQGFKFLPGQLITSGDDNNSQSGLNDEGRLEAPELEIPAEENTDEDDKQDNTVPIFSDVDEPIKTADQEIFADQEPGDSAQVIIEDVSSDNGTEEEKVEILEQEEANNVEIIKEENGGQGAPDNEEQAVDDVETMENLSFMDKIKNMFKGARAWAAEYVNGEFTDLEELGELKSAKIKFSLAFSSLNSYDNETPAVEENEATSVGEILEETGAEENLEEQTGSGLSNVLDEETDLVGEAEIQEETQEDNEASKTEIGSENEEISDNDEQNIAEPIEDEAIVEIIEVIDEPVEVEVEIETGNKDSETEQAEEISLIERFMKAAKAQTEESAKLIIWYSLDISTGTGAASAFESGQLWHKLDILAGNSLANGLNKDYFSYEADFLQSWDDINNLKIKVEGIVEDESLFIAYLDSVWVEAVVAGGAELKKITAREEWQEALELVSRQLVFKLNEAGELKFRYRRPESKIWDSISELFRTKSFWQDVDVETKLLDNSGQELDLPLTMIMAEDGEFMIKLPELPRGFRPGLYTVRFIIKDEANEETEELIFDQNFSWGVLAINTNKSVYEPLEEAYLQMAVLDDEGRTVCDADLELEITAPQGSIMLLKTSDGTLARNPECGPNNVIFTPDYYAHYQLAGAGVYRMRLTALTGNGIKEITDEFEVREEVPVVIERIGPTRIYPLANYTMQLNIQAKEKFQGELVEYLPPEFSVIKQSLKWQTATVTRLALLKKETATSAREAEFSETVINGAKEISWQNLKLYPGDELEIIYEFDAPDISPEFYLLGPIDMDGFSEARQWQIAADLFAVSTSTNGIQSGWTNATNAWDNGVNTHASRDIVKKTGTSPETGLNLESTANSSIDLGGDITKVEIGIEGYRETTDVDVYLLPKFDGTDNGTAQLVNNLPSSGSDNNNTEYREITNDTSRPLYPAAWTWQEISDLHISVYGGNNSNSQNRMLYIDQIRIQVEYTPNTAPTSTLEAAVQRPGQSGIVDISMATWDIDEDDLHARLEYGAGTSCDSFIGNATLDETDANATSTYDDVTIDNNLTYQIGSTTVYMISTDQGTNFVYFDWLSKQDVNNQEGYYCLRLTADDLDNVQTTPATTTVLIDNKAPATPGALSESGTTTKSSITLAYGTVSSDIHFKEYRIYYATSTPVKENDFLHGSTTDGNLSEADFNGEATTTVNGLEEDTTYYFAIWAIDSYGYKSSSSPVSITTNRAPFGEFASGTPPVLRSDASGIVDITIKIEDLNDDNCMAKLEYVAGADCNFAPGSKTTLDETQANIQASFGVPKMENDNDYQLGYPTGWITTPATNTIEFDWLTLIDEDTADDTYCLRLTVNDRADDQNHLATATLILDNKNPSAPGDLIQGDISTSSVVLGFGATTTESNFDRYRIYYKDGTSGLTDGDNGENEHSDGNLLHILFNKVPSTTISGLNPNTDYVFNIWAYDDYGHVASATEITFKTDATIINDSLAFTNAQVSNYAIADGISEWNFQAMVSEESGWATINNVILRLANKTDDASPFMDLEFTWDQATDAFSETGTDTLGAASIADTSTSTCAADTCTLDFKIVFYHTFATSSIDYAAELLSTNDGAITDEDSYSDFYQVKIIRIEQTHYRWRNDDGGG